ncbi:MAG: hypothetical protein ACYST2_06535 [Planctomycetota bacterium]
MRESFEKAKELKSQIAFFAFLCIALLLGKLLMIGLSGTRFTEPIELAANDWFVGYEVYRANRTGICWDERGNSNRNAMG